MILPMRYTLRQLQVFLAIAHFEHTGKAADALAMSQSACSGALKDLENQFDIALFDRVGKRLQLNELGKAIRPKVEALVDQAKSLEQSFLLNEEGGELKIGATLTIGNYLAVHLMTDYMQRHTDTVVKLEVANTQKIVSRLLNFDIDLGLIEGETHHPDLLVMPWKEDRLQCFCSPEHRFASKGMLEDTDAISADWILRESGSGTRQTFERAMHGLVPELNIKLTLQHTEAIKRAVTGNLGISCLSQIALTESFERGDLVPIDMPHRNFDRHLYIAIHREKYLSAGINNWLQLCEISLPS